MTLTPALFLHIQKTAGTAVVQMASSFYNKFISHFDYHGHKPEEFQHTGFVSGHFGYSYAQPLMKFRYSFTFLRDPGERVLSFYYYCRRSDPDEYGIYKLGREKSLDEFLDLGQDHQQVKPYIWNHQTWQLACGWYNPAGKNIMNYDQETMINEAKAHLAEFHHIGFVETLDEDMMTIWNGLGVKWSARIPTVNKGGPKPRVKDLPSSTRHRLRRITELDQILYDYARLRSHEGTR